MIVRLLVFCLLLFAAQRIDSEVAPKSSQHLLTFISITSGPHHGHYRNAARSTWLVPCEKSPLCDYRFFIDIDESRLRINDTAGVNGKLIQESFQHKDIVFRDSCPLMKRHPVEINYGNSPVAKENMERRDEFGNVIPVPDYKYRRVYKIDWKVCFLKWVYNNYPKEVDYHVFVEDDSFTCTQNLLYQMALVKKNHPPNYHFRAGWPMFDGFDDSSTIMDNGIAKVFADNYPSPKLSCSVVENAWNTSNEAYFSWTSWGNSWRHAICNWRQQLWTNFDMNVSTPDIKCVDAVSEPYEIDHLDRIQLPCLRRPLVLHHPIAGHLLTKEEHTGRELHVCEYMLLIDKIKETSTMQMIYNNTNKVEQHYHDFSSAFLHDKGLGWHDVLVKLNDEERECEKKLANLTDIPPYYCLFEQPESRNRRLKILGSLFPQTLRQHKLSSFSVSRSYSFRDFFEF